MGKFHINPQTGKPMPCNAENGNCPYGEGTQHFTSQQEANNYSQQMFEKVISTNPNDIADCLDNNFCKDDALKTARDNGIDLLKHYKSQGRLNEFPKVVGDKNLTKDEVDTLYEKGVYHDLLSYDTTNCLLDEKEIKYMAETMADCSDDYYIDDAFKELAEEWTPNAYDDETMKIVKANPYILENEPTETEWDDEIEELYHKAIFDAKVDGLNKNREQILCNGLARRVYGVDGGNSDAMEFIECIKNSTHDAEFFGDIFSNAVNKWRETHDCPPPVRDWVIKEYGSL